MSESLLMLVPGPIAALAVRLAVPGAREYLADAAGASSRGTRSRSRALRKIVAGTGP